MHVTADQFAGCMLGLATGDALGARYEGGLLERLVWRVIGRTSDGCLRWTDDTQMALDLAESLLAEGGVHPEALAKRFASSYRWSRGYGPGAARVLKHIRRGEPWQVASKAVYAGDSYGNGAAMRAPVLALFFPRDRNKLITAARTSAGVAHAHPLGLEGAVLIGIAAHARLEGRSTAQLLDLVRAMCSTPEISERLKTVQSWIELEQAHSARGRREARQWDYDADIVSDGPLRRASAHEVPIRRNDGLHHRVPWRRGHDWRALGDRERRLASATSTPRSS